jgi:hypothetical protein
MLLNYDSAGPGSSHATVAASLHAGRAASHAQREIHFSMEDNDE